MIKLTKMIKLTNILKETKVSPKSKFPPIITVIKDGYYITTDNMETNVLIDEDELKGSFPRLLVKGDIWRFIEIDEDGIPIYKCIKGEWLDEINAGWWSYDNAKEFFYKGVKEI
jgi:hypothetical protein